LASRINWGIPIANEVDKKYRKNWKENVDRISCENIPKKKRRKCHPIGRKALGRPMKRWTACFVNIRNRLQ
jgi:hypothetical protein